MELKEISFKDLIRPKEDPSKNYPFNPKPIDVYNRNPDTNKVSYGTQEKLYGNTLKYNDWDYHKNKRKSLEYASPKPFSGSYAGGGCSSYSSSMPRPSSGSYRAAA